MKTFSVKINVSTGSDKEIAGLLKKKLGMSEFSHGELRVHRVLLAYVQLNMDCKPHQIQLLTLFATSNAYTVNKNRIGGNHSHLHIGLFTWFSAINFERSIYMNIAILKIKPV